MTKKKLKYFKDLLKKQLDDLLAEAGGTVKAMSDKEDLFPDPIDRASLESEARALRDGAVLYLIADETGSLPVFSSHAPEGKLPKAGSQVAATGRLSVSADNRASMRVRGPGRIKVLENAAPTIIRGLVAVVWSPPPDSRAPYRMILDRPEGQMEVVYWFVPEHRVTVGARVEVKGTLSFYKGRMQLKVRAAEDIRFHQER